MSGIYTSVDQLIGGTPLLELVRIQQQEGLRARILAKLEHLNPGGSTKDRVGRALIDDAEARGLLRPGSVIIEPTSGNTGIGLACVAAARGYRHRHARLYERGAPEAHGGLRRGGGPHPGGPGDAGSHPAGGRTGSGDPRQLHPRPVR